MKSYLFSVCVCVTLSLGNSQLMFAQSDTDWKPINVSGLTEWSDPGKWWTEQDGVVVAESKGGKDLPQWHYLNWNGSLAGDFELKLEYRIEAEQPQDAGVNFRVEAPPKPNAKGNLIGYQAELDTANLYSKQKFIRQGKLFGHIHDGKRGRMFQRGNRVTIEPDGSETAQPLKKKFQPAKVFRKPPAWNECHIVVKGDLIQLYLNGQLANEIIDRDPKQKSTGDGIALQFRPTDAYRFEVRNLMYQPLKP